MAKLFKEQISTTTDTFIYLTNNQITKPTMLLLHGFSADKTIWLKFARHAGKDFNLIIPDLLGHGDIPYSTQQNYSAFTQAKYVRRFIYAIGLKGSITIVGNSMGGMIGAILNSNIQGNDQVLSTQNSQPDADSYFNTSVTIENLVLIDPAGAKSEFAMQNIALCTSHFIHRTTQESFDFYKFVMHKPPFMPPSVLAYISQTNYLQKQQQYQHMFADFFNPSEFFDKAMQSRCKKVLLIWGEQDQLLPVQESSHWQKLLPCETYILPYIGHMPMVECPAITYSFIKSTTSQ
jgi:pimeloyl-ACP methyl ester carboxylesterase